MYSLLRRRYSAIVLYRSCGRTVRVDPQAGPGPAAERCLGTHELVLQLGAAHQVPDNDHVGHRPG